MCAIHLILLGENTGNSMPTMCWVLPYVPFPLVDFSPHPFSVILITTNIMAFLSTVSPTSELLNLIVVLGTSLTLCRTSVLYTTGEVSSLYW